MATTLKDIADRSGVSIKTVSRVLNKEPNVSASTRTLVEAAASHLGYRPNLAAKGLASSRSFFLAVLYDSVSSSYVLSLIDGATRACRAAGYHLVVQPVNDEALSCADTVSEFLRNLHVDGLILTPPLSDNAHLLAGLDALGIPCVRLAPVGGASHHAVIRIADEAAASEVTEHLIDQGHTRIGFIRGLPGHSATPAREAGYRAALQSAGVAFDPALVMDGDFSWRSGREAARALTALPQPPTAVFASNDDMAAGVLKWLGETGLRCPEDVAVAGFDDTPLSRVVHPELTTVGQDVEGMGELCVRMLTSTGGGQGEERTVALDLVARASTTNEST